MALLVAVEVYRRTHPEPLAHIQCPPCEAREQAREEYGAVFSGQANGKASDPEFQVTLKTVQMTPVAEGLATEWVYEEYDPFAHTLTFTVAPPKKTWSTQVTEWFKARLP